LSGTTWRAINVRMDRISARNVTGCNRCVKTYSLLENLCVSKCEKAVTASSMELPS